MPPACRIPLNATVGDVLINTPAAQANAGDRLRNSFNPATTDSPGHVTLAVSRHARVA
jgi:hypothetical protein